jgi:hypothetical protein
MKRLCLSAVIELPTDLFDATAIIQSVKVPWQNALEALGAAGATFQHSQEVMEVKTKATRKPRKPRLVETPPQDAA